MCLYLFSNICISISISTFVDDTQSNNVIMLRRTTSLIKAQTFIFNWMNWLRTANCLAAYQSIGSVSRSVHLRYYNCPILGNIFISDFIHVHATRYVDADNVPNIQKCFHQHLSNCGHNLFWYLKLMLK